MQPICKLPPSNLLLCFCRVSLNKPKPKSDQTMTGASEVPTKNAQVHTTGEKRVEAWATGLAAFLNHAKTRFGKNLTVSHFFGSENYSGAWCPLTPKTFFAVHLISAAAGPVTFSWRPPYFPAVTWLYPVCGCDWLNCRRCFDWPTFGRVVCGHCLVSLSQTPSTGLQHPFFGGRCRKAMLEVCFCPSQL